ncbi:hypothetical protein PM082_022281 [Marasmius tenuissimus]|nr:hypothetical protein PM082_022281 [Marasmius tenuissimus]
MTGQPLEDFVFDSLSRWEALQREIRARPESTKIFSVDWMAGLSSKAGEEPERDLEALNRLAQTHGIRDPAQLGSLWTWQRLPFTIRQAGLKSLRRQRPYDGGVGTGFQHAELIENIDLWIPKNESYLRFLSRKLNMEQTRDSKPWTFGLVHLARIADVLSQPHNLSTTRLEIFRPVSLAGFCVLGGKRGEKIHVQPSQEAFVSSWSRMTGGVLNGLNWSNVFVAGGSVLGTLITPETDEGHTDHNDKGWLASDIDLYIWGLSVHEANAKIKHVAQVYKSNLPEGAPFVAARNSQTITLYSSWPTRRVQIVLKLVANPREVLLNFDLDPCTVGYDGTSVWMLPRFVRALETGYTMFTMDLLRGHYLEDRKATRDVRVFKYAEKGFGIWISASYLSACGGFEVEDLLESTSNNSRLWTSRFVKFQKYCKFFMTQETIHDEESALPEHSYSQLYMKAAIPQGGSLSSFPLFMRHVALWEQALIGKIRIVDGLQLKMKEEDGDVYYDTDPPYQWNSDFSIPKFRNYIDDYNTRLTTSMEETAEYLLSRGRYSWDSFEVRRLTYSASGSGVLSEENDLELPLILPKGVVLFSNSLLLETLQKYGVEDSEPPLQVLWEDDTPMTKGLCLVIWKINNVLNWQGLDRKADEVREILWVYYKRMANRCVGDRNLLHYQRRRTRASGDIQEFVEWLSGKV